MNRLARPRLLGILVLAGTLTGLTGCFSCLHPIEPPSKEQLHLCYSLPECSRNKVYIILAHGHDILDCANLDGVEDNVRKLGFIKTYFGPWYEGKYFAEEIRRLHKEDGERRFVLIGVGHGCSTVRAVAAAVQPDHIGIDLVVYVSGCPKEDSKQDRLQNVEKVINIQSKCGVPAGSSPDHGQHVVYPEVGTLAAPTHPHTLDILAHELTAVACRVPVIVRMPPPDPFQTPTPHPVKEAPEGPRDEWDFLKPQALYTPAPPAGNKDAPKEQGKKS
jgi:hypothetical protein